MDKGFQIFLVFILICITLIALRLQMNIQDVKGELFKYTHSQLCPNKYHVEEIEYKYQCVPIKLSSGSGN